MQTEYDAEPFLPDTGMEGMAEEAFAAEWDGKAAELRAARERSWALKEANRADWLGCALVLFALVPAAIAIVVSSFGALAGGVVGFLVAVGLGVVSVRQAVRMVRDKRKATPTVNGRPVRRDKYIEMGVSQYKEGVPQTVAKVHSYVVERFRDRVAAHRQRMLGPHSDWANARDPLQGAVREAESSVAYWRARADSDAGNELADTQVQRATAIEEKLVAALSEVDKRSDLLRKFYLECEARLKVMNARNRDLEEVDRLNRLQDESGAVIAQAGAGLQQLAASFARDAQGIGRLLTDAGQLQLKSLAGEASLDDMEFLADRIIEDAERDEDRIAALQRSLLAGSA